MNTESSELVDEQAFSWLEMHKKSALSYLILRALYEQPMWSQDLAYWIQQKTQWNITERALYRVLRRLQKQGMLTHTVQNAARTGADRKVYGLTAEGVALLELLKGELRYLNDLA